MADGASQRVQPERLNAILARAKESDKGKIRKNAVTIPQSTYGGFTVAPRADAGMRPNLSVQNDIERRKQNAERMRALTRKIGVK